MKRTAIIGTGIAGLGCAHFLHPRRDLTLFEQNDYIGGHTNTITVAEAGRPEPVPIDTGFMVFNHVTYPNLSRLFRELELTPKPTDMSFSVSHLPSGLEYNGGNFNTLFGQRRNLVSPRFWRMLLAIDRFNQEAVAALDDPRYASHTVGQYVAERRYGDDFLHLYLVPMSSAVWSTPPELMLAFPAVTLLRFFHNHGFLGRHTAHPWLTMPGGAKTYVEKITRPFRDRIALNAPVARVRRETAGVRVETRDGASHHFDEVIFATHADQTLRLLENPTALEAALLSEFHYQPNPATLHTDERFMPRNRRCWAAWNYRIDPKRRAANGAVLPTTHYWMNRLQGVSDTVNYFVSLNSDDAIDPAKVLKRIPYEHPVFSLGAIAAQRRLAELNTTANEGRVFFCGAWFKYGFHEDGFTSALECSRAVTGEPLWC
jgi:predicted NAD/FAD-binding protein